MNLSKLKLFFLVLTSVITGATYTNDNTTVNVSESQPSTLTAEPQKEAVEPEVVEVELTTEERDSIVAQLIRQVETMDFMAKDILIDLNRNTIKLKATKKEISKLLNSFQDTCAHLLLSLDVTQNTIAKKELYDLQQKVHKLALYLEEAIKKNLSDIEKFDLKAVQTKALPIDITLQDFDLACAETNKVVLKVGKRIPYLGINFFRRSFRSLESINERYHILEGALLATAIAGFTTYVIYKMPYFNTGLHTTITIRKGEVPQVVNADEATVGGIPLARRIWKRQKELRGTLVDKSGKLNQHFVEFQNMFFDENGLLKSKFFNKNDINTELVESQIKEFTQNRMKLDKNFTNEQADYFMHVCAEVFGGTPLAKVKDFLTNVSWTNRLKETYNLIKDYIGHPVLRRVDGELDVHQEINSPIAFFDSLVRVGGLGLTDVAAGTGFYAVTKKYGSVIRRKYGTTKRKLIDFCHGGPSKKSKHDAKVVNGGLDQVIGNAQAKKSMADIIEFMVEPEKFKRKNLLPPKGVMLMGPSRSGKTFIAEMTAGEICKRRLELGKEEVKFIPLDTLLLSHYSLREIIEICRYENGPCIIFIDEIHNLRLTTDGNSQLLTDFLTTMSGFENDSDKDPVIIIAATNNPEKIDHALLQNGRFGKQIVCEFPNQEERAVAIDKALIKYNISITDPALLTFAQELMIATEGKSHEDIKQVFENALQQSIVTGKALCLEHFERAMDEEIYHIERSTKRLEAHERKFLASQLAGTVMGIRLFQPEKIITRATMKPVKQPVEEATWYEKNLKKDYTLDGGVFSFNRSDTLSITSNGNLIAEAKVLLAPSVAEEIICGTQSTFNTENKQKAIELVQKHVLKGIGIDALSRDRKNALLDQVIDLEEKCEQEVKEALLGRKEQLEKLTSTLRKHPTLGQVDLYMIILTEAEKQDMIREAQEMQEMMDQEAKSAAAISADLEATA